MATTLSEKFTVQQPKVRGLSEAVAQLSRKAGSKGLGPIRLDLGVETRATSEVVLSTRTPAIGDYLLLARIDHLKNGMVYIRPVGDQHLDFARVRRQHADQRCDHCGVRRSRRVTYLLESTAGSEVQVGSSCLSEYVGDSDPRKALVQADLFSKARELVVAAIAQDTEPPTTNPERMSRKVPPVDEYLLHVATVIRSQGEFVRKADVDSESAATATIALENYRLERGWVKDNAGEPAWIEPTSAERKLVERMTLEFREFAGRDDVDDYDRRLHAMLNKDLAWPENQGVLATMFERVHSLRKRYGGRYGSTSPENHRKFLGKVGEKVDLVATLTGIGKSVETRFGPQYPHYFTTSDGYLASWFATNITLEVGETYEVRGEIKRHTRFRHDRITQLTKCRTKHIEAQAKSK